MERPASINLTLKSIESQLRLLSNNELNDVYFTKEELIKLGDLADQVAQIRFPITIKE